MSAVVPDDALVAEVGGLPGVSVVEVREGRVVVVTSQSDEVALWLLSRGARDMEITAPSLESAFVELTGRDQA